MYRTVLTFATALSLVFLPAVLFAWLLSLQIRTHFGAVSVLTPRRLVAAIAIPLVMGVRELFKNSLTLSGVVAAMFVGFVLTLASASFIMSLLVCFLTASRLTRFRASKKAKLDEEAAIGARRNCWNVLYNGGVPTSLAILYIIEVGCGETAVAFNDPHRYISSWLSVAIIGAISCACGDTWASEVGPAFGTGSATLIVNGNRVPAGTNGGVTVIGTLASIAGGFLVGFTFALTNFIFVYSNSLQWSFLWIGAFSGFIGSFVDSLLGATMQYSGYNEVKKRVVGQPGPDVRHISGVPLLSNHSVNFISCCITSLLAPASYQLAMAFVAG